jgi:hypothetical protein
MESALESKDNLTLGHTFTIMLLSLAKKPYVKIIGLGYHKTDMLLIFYKISLYLHTEEGGSGAINAMSFMIRLEIYPANPPSW